MRFRDRPGPAVSGIPLPGRYPAKRVCSLFLLAGVLMLGRPETSAAARVEIQGLSGELKQNVTAFVESVPERADVDEERFRVELQDACRQALQALGYYQPVIAVDPVSGESGIVTVRIDPGKPVRVTRIDLRISGAAEADDAFRRIVAEPSLRVGDPFHHGKYENLKADIVDLAVARGYFDGRWQEAKVVVSIAGRSARIDLHYDSGPRYVFGDLVVSGAPEHEEIIRATRPFVSGDPYSAATVAEYNADLNDTNFFRSVLVRPDLENRAEGVVPVVVQVTPQPRNIVSVGAGISTDTGPRGTLRWTVPRLNRHGHSLTTGIKASLPEQEAVASYKVPLEDAHENFALLQAGYKRKDNEDTLSNKYSVQLKRLSKFSSEWERVYQVSFEIEDYRQSFQRDISRLILPGISFTRERVRGGLNVHWGDRLQCFLEVSDPTWGSDTRLARLQARVKWIRTAGERREHKLILRTDLGGIAVDSILDVPSSLRFFTGGDQTIRGFNYESIGPRDPSDRLIGGKYLAVGSVEYGYLLLEKWRLAGFVDAGTATNDFSEPVSVGSGVGLRWLTPVGPLRLDWAFALSEPGNPWMIHFSMGPDI